MAKTIRKVTKKQYASRPMQIYVKKPKADVAISYPSKAEAVLIPKHLTMIPAVAIVTWYYSGMTRSCEVQNSQRTYYFKMKYD